MLQTLETYYFNDTKQEHFPKIVISDLIKTGEYILTK